ncbi:homoserine O-succinyltransferase [Pectobacterium versatile]|jgi:homoserine O-succinyltransferase|uniref:Homoserine O-succinyltransferase n=1 Tax=Pectobacterium versatile TaxID=2488639 RepID=A0A7V8PH73_9GAMM|nr:MULTISPECIES: homoserine O-succinyltransferase [Pectobacterium]AVT60508.1 homoserine O-succinyltransferase [Pectobacterium versatile]AZK64387.1 homoserine O-succinyltransferase [Pectobacterium versatile]KHS83344.1 homoserine O-succinyltransferase [Pectobacterium carotovorum subsp. carotovorum]MBA0161288.1 homoserine O-succinyltransferase [Pectobacterium versatile]MBA0165295.1 homoserine O-succinyltransferase [Pectobacterium versatile]
MPIRVPDELPAVNFLRNENVFVMTSSRAKTQEIRPLKVLVLNLMPKKIETENQFLRLLSNSPLQIDIQLLRIDSRESKNTPTEHLNNFYCNFDDIQDENFDGLIVTGAPLGLVDFCDVVYWPQIARVIEWAKEHVTSTLFVCWAVQAALNILYGIPKMTRKEKLSGVYLHQTLQPHALLTRGFDETFLAPHSRYADFPADVIRQHTDLEILVESEQAGAYLFASKDKRLAFVTGHPEYDVLTLAGEFFRDCDAGLDPTVPVNYFPDDNPELAPKASWRSHGHLLFVNWLNYYVYQITPYDLRRMNPTLD